jgi:hypothetical protein
MFERKTRGSVCRVQLVTALGSAATPKQLTPTASMRGAQRLGSGGGLTPQGSGGAALAAQHATAAAGQPRVSADMLSAALRDTLRLAAPAGGAGGQEGESAGGGGSGPGSARSGGLGEAARAPSGGSMHSMPTSDSMHSMHSVVNRMMTDLVSDAFTATPTASRSVRSASLPGPADEGPGAEGTSAALAGGAGREVGEQLPAAAPVLAPGVELQLWVEEGDEERPVRLALAPRDPTPLPSPFASPTLTPTPAALEAAVQQAQRDGAPATPHASLELLEERGPSGEASQRGSGKASQRGSVLPLTPHTSAAAPEECQVQQAAVAATAPAASAAMAAAASSPPGGEASPGEAAVRRALLVQQFLEGSPSQLTFHGLAALHEGLQPGQLAVFFRWGRAAGAWAGGPPASRLPCGPRTSPPAAAALAPVRPRLPR